MSSKPLRDLTALVIDNAALDGPITRRGVAEEIVQQAKQMEGDGRCVFDFQESDEWIVEGVVRHYVTEYMNRPLSAHVAATVVNNLPEALRKTLQNVPSFICISPRGGAGARHVNTLLATAEHLKANLELKDFVVERAEMSRDNTRSWLDLMTQTGAETLGEAINRASSTLVMDAAE
jgi:hypothetical protein